MSFKTISIEEFYIKIHKDLMLIESYLEYPNLSNILKSCRLKPQSYINNKTIRTKLHNTWCDEFNSHLNLNEKELSITHNNLYSKSVSTDMYYGLSIKNILKISQLIFIQIGNCDDTNKFRFFLSFYCIDNYFRSYIFEDNWKQCSSLYLGLDNLNIILNRLGLIGYVQLSNENNPMELLNSKTYLSQVPFNDEFKKILNKHFELEKILL